MQENNVTLKVAGVVTIINMVTIGILGFPIGFFTGSLFTIVRNGLFIGSLVGLATVLPYIRFTGGARMSLEHNVPAVLGALMADGILMWVTVMTGGFFDAWTWSTILKQIVMAVAAGSLLGCPLAIAMLGSRKKRADDIKAF